MTHNHAQRAGKSVVRAVSRVGDHAQSKCTIIERATRVHTKQAHTTQTHTTATTRITSKRGVDLQTAVVAAQRLVDLCATA
jgi:hypothetical protein